MPAGVQAVGVDVWGCELSVVIFSAATEQGDFGVEVFDKAWGEDSC